MSENFYASINFRTKDVKERPELVKELKSWFGDDKGAVTNDGTTQFSDENAHLGEFPDLEDFCEEHNIPYDRYSSSCYGYTACTKYFRPDRGVIIIDEDEQSGSEYILKDDVMRLTKVNDSELRQKLNELLESYSPVPLDKYEN